MVEHETTSHLHRSGIVETLGVIYFKMEEDLIKPGGKHSVEIFPDAGNRKRKELLRCYLT